MKLQIPNEQTFTEVEIKFPLSFKHDGNYYHFESEDYKGIEIYSRGNAILNKSTDFIKTVYGAYEECTKQEVRQAFDDVVNYQKKKFITIDLNDNTPTDLLEKL